VFDWRKPMESIRDTRPYQLFSSPALQKGIRFVRTIIISVSIYQIGYHNGMVHFAQDPKTVEQELIKYSLQVPQEEPLEAHVHARTSTPHIRVRNVGERVVAAGKKVCEMERVKSFREFERLQKKVRSSEEESAFAEIAETCVRWQKACKRMEGKWSFVVSKSSQINAFVTGVLPRKVFICSGLLDRLDLTDDELAMIMGHELSHCILGHVEEDIPLGAILLGIQLGLMTFVDPTGMSAYFFDASVAWLRDIVNATYSRQHETEADELGLLLTSMACFDTSSGKTVHAKMARMSPTQHTQLLHTHPASAERSEKLELLSQQHAERLKTDPLLRGSQDCSMYRSMLPGFRFGF